MENNIKTHYEKYRDYQRNYYQTHKDYWSAYQEINKEKMQEYHRQRYQNSIKDKPKKEPKSTRYKKLSDKTLTPQEREAIRKRHRDNYKKRKLSKIYDNSKKCK